ncbi:MAG: hypothetical protein V2J07_07850, partial [Anaerolineae bacterium]|nr:hypothetical protein [Anaerolineae bacterium]
EDDQKPGTAALEEWMADPTTTHGMTGMLLDGLETGTLPPMEDEEESSGTDYPDWMSDLPDEEYIIHEQPETTAAAVLDEEHISEDQDSGILPDWLSGLPEEEEKSSVFDTAKEEIDDTTPGTGTLEEWMTDPTTTRGMTGMLLDELDTGTLPPLEGYEDEEPADEETLSAVTSDLPDWMENPEASRGQTGDLLDSLDTGTLLPLYEDEEDEAVEAEELPDWLSEMEIEPAIGDGDEAESPPDASTMPLDDIAATSPLQDIAATHALPDWMSEMTEEGGVSEDEESSIELADFISTGDELPDWIDEVAAEDQGEDEETEDGSFESAFKTSPEIMAQDPTAMLPDWVNDMGSMHGRTGMLIDNLETDDTKALGTSELPDWLSEYSGEDLKMGEPPTASQTDIDAWLVEQTAPEEVIEEEDDGLEPLITTDTGELNQWIAENGISALEGDQDEAEMDEDLFSIDVQSDLPEWVLDLEPDETSPMSPDTVTKGGTAALPEWVVGDEEPEFDVTQEAPPMDSELFSFIDEEAGEETVTGATIAIDDDIDLPAMFDEESSAGGVDDLEAFDITAFEDRVSGDSLFDEPVEDDGEEVTAEDLFSATTPPDFSADDDLSQGEEISPFDISQLEDIEENYTPAMELDDQSHQWLGEYAEEEENLFEEPPVPVDPFSISVEEVEEAESEGIEMAEELPDWVGQIEAAESAEELWETPIAAMAAISASVQTSLDEEQPDIDQERAHIQLMERILLSEKGTVAVASPHRRAREVTLRLMLTLMVIVAVLAGLYSMVPPRSDFVNNAPAAVVKFDQAIDFYQANLSNKPVLVVFDYQPAYHEEISVYAELPLKTLMANDARIFTFSTLPEGPALGQKMLFETVMRNGLQYNTQSQAVPMGYLPGGSNAIRDFSTRMRSVVHGLDVGSSGVYLWDLPMVTDVDSIDDFALVLVLTDDLDKARLWIEQSTMYLPETTPMLMVTSARISPMLRPYLLSEQLDGHIGSAVDAAAYGNPELSNQVGNYIYYWRSYQLGIYLMVATIIAGAVLQIMRQLQRAFKRGNS